MSCIPEILEGNRISKNGISSHAPREHNIDDEFPMEYWLGPKEVLGVVCLSLKQHQPQQQDPPGACPHSPYRVATQANFDGPLDQL